jgi:hypothetical protein
VACAFINNNMAEAVLVLWDAHEHFRLEACTFESNKVLHHNLWQQEKCVYSRFYSDSFLDVWCEETQTTFKTQPLAALPVDSGHRPADTGILTAEDPFLSGLQQVCAGRLVSSMHIAAKSASLSCARLASSALQVTLRGT